MDMPLRESRRFIAVAAQVNVGRYLAHRLLEAKIHRRRVHRIAFEDHQHVDLAGVHVRDKLLQPRSLIGRHQLHRIGIDDSLPDISQRLVDLRCKNMEFRRLLISSNNNGGSSVRLQIFRQSFQELLFICTETLRRRSRATAEHPGQRCSERNNLRCAHRQTIVGERSGCGRETLHHIQAIHWSVGSELATADEVVRVTQKSREMRAGEKVSIERQHYVRRFELINRLGILPEQRLRSRARRIAIHRFPLIPLCPRELLQHCLNL